ncbi:SOS response-associated peptidase family protein [Adlercreutzia sp. ZJ305]|uniref:SOS response-associated peptidase family protein n=2 Tax=unclassified Adlercreutzia TaxID=2636013 RepID=UPI0013ED9331|nr:SOS response-associated peptidase family protein [Adlercreutzia sp. ZJ305]
MCAMCGRCVILTFDEVLEVIREIEVNSPVNIEPDWPARRPLAYPKASAPLIVPKFDTALASPALASEALSARELSWGFEESWKPGVVFNTRIESTEKPTWRDSMEHRRCVIPVRAFFETHREETYPSPKTGRPVKRQYEFCVPGQNVVLIGCIWRSSTFSMVTTEANADMAPIHHRMPLIVRQEELPLWFGPGYRKLADRSSIRLEAKRA